VSSEGRTLKNEKAKSDGRIIEPKFIDLGFESLVVTMKLSLTDEPPERVTSRCSSRYQIWPDKETTSEKPIGKENDFNKKSRLGPHKEGFSISVRPKSARPFSPNRRTFLYSTKQSTKTLGDIENRPEPFLEIKGQNLLAPFSTRKRTLLRQSKADTSNEPISYRRQALSARYTSLRTSEATDKFLQVL
jgi:hypothetical protein